MGDLFKRITYGMAYLIFLSFVVSPLFQNRGTGETRAKIRELENNPIIKQYKDLQEESVRVKSRNLGYCIVSGIGLGALAGAGYHLYRRRQERIETEERIG